MAQSKKNVLSGNNSHRLSAMLSGPFNPQNGFVLTEQNMFKRVQSSYGNRAKSIASKDDRDPITDYDSTKVSSQAKNKRCLSIRSGAFRI